MSSFYKEFPCNFFFTWKSFVKIFPNLKLEIEFHSHKKVVSPKVENCAHLNIVNFMCAKFQQNQRTFFFTWKSFVNFSQLSNLKLSFIPIKKLLHQNSIFPHIYLSWTLSVPNFRKIKETFLSRSRELAHNYHIIFFTRKLSPWE